MALKCLKTLTLRMERLFKSSYTVPTFLEAHPKIEKVIHPSLRTNKNRKIALKQSGTSASCLSTSLKQSPKILQSCLTLSHVWFAGKSRTRTWRNTHAYQAFRYAQKRYWNNWFSTLYVLESIEYRSWLLCRSILVTKSIKLQM